MIEETQERFMKEFALGSALDYAKSISGMTPEAIVDVAEKFYKFLAGQAK